MYADGEPSGNPQEPGGADQASTSGSSGEALSKQAHDNPAFVGNAAASTSRGEQQPPDVRSGEPRTNPAPEGPPGIPLQNDAGWVPMMFSPIMVPGNPEGWNGMAGITSTGTPLGETFPPGMIPMGTFPPGTAEGTMAPQFVPVLFPVQMPIFMPPSNQAGQNAGCYSLPIFGFPGMAPGAPAGFKFPGPMYVPVPMEGILPGATAGQEVGDAGRAPPVVVRGEVPLGRVGQLNEVPPIGQAEVPDQRRVVRRFQVGIQLDLLLLLKLAVIVFVFNQDGSKDRLLLLLGLACVIYLYQTSSLAPLLRWIAERAQQFMTPPHNVAQAPPNAQRAPDAQAREAPGAEVANPAAEEPAAGEAAPEAPAEGANAQQGPFLAFVKEVQMLVVGFVTSLLPGFHPHAD